MIFLQSAMLWGLLAASIPIIIHLLNRRRHRTIQWAAMQFLLKATRESRGKKRLRHILILTCRTLGIAALVTAAAVPVVSSLFGLGNGQPDLVVLVLDRSASMEGNPESGSIPRRELALQRLRDAFADLPGTRLVLIDSASGKAQDVPSPSVLPELSATAATDTAADLPALLTSAAEYLVETPGRAEVWIASDLQRTSWSPDDDRWNSVRDALAALPQPPRVRVLALTGESAGNQSIRILASRRTGTRLLLDLELSRNGDALQPIAIPLTTTLNGAQTTETLSLAGQWLRFQKSIEIPERAPSGFGWVSLPGDGNPRDNTSFFAYGPVRPVRNVVVAPSGEAADYLALAAAPDGFGGQSAETMPPANAASLVTEEFAAVLWAAPLPEGAVARELERFLSAGGHVVFLPPANDSETSFLDMKWGPLEEARHDQFFILDSWDHDDGLMRDGIDGTPLPADRLRGIKRRVPDGEAAILARWDDARPFLVRRVIGRGTAWFLGSLPDYAWSNLPDADVLLPAVQRAVLAGADRFDSGYLATLGTIAAQPEVDETLERLDQQGVEQQADPAHLAGVFRLGERTLAINRPADEDVPDVMETDALDTLFEGTSYTLFEDASTSARESVSRGVWRGFLIALLFFLLAEALLCLPHRPAAPSAATQRMPT